MPSNALTTRQANLRCVRTMLLKMRQATKAELARKTGLSIVSVASMLDTLCEMGIARKTTIVPSSGGRPAQAFAFCENAAHAMLVTTRTDGAVERVNACVANLYGEIQWETTQHVDAIDVRSFESLVNTCRQKFPTLRVLAFSMPGVLENGIITVHDYPGMRGQALCAHYSNLFHLSVLYENDVNAAILGFAAREAIHPAATAIGVYFPGRFPPGAGLLLHGELYSGPRGLAGEVATLPLPCDWCSLPYADVPLTTEAIDKVLHILSAVLDADHLVIYGDFLTPAHEKALIHRMQGWPEAQHARALPRLHFQTNIDRDMQRGLIQSALKHYEEEGYTT